MSPSLPRQWQSYVEKIQARLVARKLLAVLESFPFSTAFEFCETILQGQECNKLLLGARKQADGEQANVWAYILPNTSGLIPPLLFRDEISLIAGRRREYPRAATSLLRKATDLYPPFCFLQADPHDNVTGIRDMLCAVVLYYALSAGVNDYATRWNNFEPSLFEALKYITNRAEYRQWGKTPLSDVGATLNVDNVQNDVETTAQEVISISTENEIKAIGDDGETIRSTGSLVKVRNGTKLAKFKAILGSKARLLDQIPQVPVFISRQNLYPTYFPVRLRIGTFCLHDASESPLIDVHVYLTGSGKATTRILAHSPDGQEMSWNFHGLQEVDLVEPFAQFAAVTKCDPRTQGNKIRQLVHYYFMIAENEGLLDAPPIQVHESLLSSFCAACKSFDKQEKDVYTSSDTVAPTSGESTDDTTPDTTPDTTIEPTEEEENVRSDSQSRKTSLIVRLRLSAEAIERITSTAISTHRLHVPDSKGEEDEMSLDGSVQQENQLHELRPVTSIEVQMSSRQASEDSHAVTPNLDHRLTAHSEAETVHTDIQSDVQDTDCDSTLGSCSMSISPVHQAEHEVVIESRFSAAATPDEALHDETNVIGIISRTGSPTSRRSRTPANPLIRRDVDQQRALSVSSSTRHENDVLVEESVPHPTVLSSRPHLVERHRAVSVISISSSNDDPPRSQIIDLCSDSEDNGEVKRTPNLSNAPRSFQFSGLSREHQDTPVSSGPKRKSDFFSGSNDDDGIREVGGDGWRRASWSRSQANRVKSRA